MAWYNNIFNREQVEDEEKLNPAQVIIARDEGFSLGTTEDFIDKDGHECMRLKRISGLVNQIKLIEEELS